MYLKCWEDKEANRKKTKGESRNPFISSKTPKITFGSNQSEIPAFLSRARATNNKKRIGICITFYTQRQFVNVFIGAWIACHREKETEKKCKIRKVFAFIEMEMPLTGGGWPNILQSFELSPFEFNALFLTESIVGAHKIALFATHLKYAF